MTILHLWIARDPIVGQWIGHRFHMHALAHLGSYALLALAWTCGLPRASATIVILAIAAFGFAQETLEVVGHGHALELTDVLIDAIGAVLGGLSGSVLRQLWAKSQ